MPGIPFHCPSCHAPLRGPASLAPGTTVRCRKCDAVFRYQAEAGASPPVPVRDSEDRRPPRAGGAESRIRRAEGDDSPPLPRRPRDDQGPPARHPGELKGGRPRSGLLLGLCIGGGVGVLLLVVVVVALGAWLSGPVKPANPVVAQSSPPPAAPPPADVGVAFNPAPAAGGALAADVLDRVKKATVYIRVTGADGVASGSGFFEASSCQVLTNAHVVGMLHADEGPPQKVEVVLNSGERDERTLAARILAVDRVSDLAVLGVDPRAAGLAGPPATLAVASADGLRETQQVFVFGFPFGEGLGKNITVSTSSVSSLRKDKDGVLAQVQVNGGMNPGNSGGPVVDAAGNVVGVAVAGIKGAQIDFAIPGDSAQAVFRGRCSGVAVGEAVRKDGQIAVPVDVTAIDPMRRISRFSIDWWTGDPADSVPPSTARRRSTWRPAGSTRCMRWWT